MALYLRREDMHGGQVLYRTCQVAGLFVGNRRGLNLRYPLPQLRKEPRAPFKGTSSSPDSIGLLLILADLWVPHNPEP